MRRLTALSAVALAATSTVALSPAASAAEQAPLKYVAMGDSYSAGSGILPLSSFAGNPGCAQSTRNVGHVLASQKGLDLTDVSCGGAQTKDFANAQSPTAGPQYDALSKDTQLVTMTIGGNDGSVFGDALTTCAGLGVATLGFGKPCTNKFGTTQIDQINNVTYPALVKAIQGVKQRAPQAKVAIAGYPQIMPQDGSACYAKMPIARGDIPYVNKLEKTLNAAIQRAANETGATFVDMWSASEGHDACKPLGTRWVEPLLWGTNFVPVHPNALGYQAYAARYSAVLGL